MSKEKYFLSGDLSLFQAHGLRNRRNERYAYGQRHFVIFLMT